MNLIPLQNFINMNPIVFLKKVFIKNEKVQQKKKEYKKIYEFNFYIYKKNCCQRGQNYNHIILTKVYFFYFFFIYDEFRDKVILV